MKAEFQGSWRNSVVNSVSHSPEIALSSVKSNITDNAWRHEMVALRWLFKNYKNLSVLFVVTEFINVWAYFQLLGRIDFFL